MCGKGGYSESPKEGEVKEVETVETEVATEEVEAIINEPANAE